MGLGDIVDQFHDDNGLADAGAAEQANLAALGVWRQQIDYLDAGGQNFRFRRLIDEGRRGVMDGGAALGYHRAAIVDRVADHIDDTPQGFGSHRHHDWRAGIGDFLAANKTFGGVHGDGANRRLAEMLGHFEDQQAVAQIAVKGIENGGKIAFKLHIDDSADNLSNLAV